MFLETSDDTWILPCIPHRIDDGYFRRGAYNTQNVLVLLFWTGFTHQLGGFSLSSSRICIQLPPYPQTTTSSYFWAELCILRYIYRACPTTNDRIIAPEEERGKKAEIIFENVSFCLLIAYNLFWYIFRMTNLFLDN